jgi:hypothetical protein
LCKLVELLLTRLFSLGLSLGTGSIHKGLTIRTLPLLRGYYRTSTSSSDVRRCPDANAGCQQSSMSFCRTSTSGCLGGSALNIVGDNQLIGDKGRALRVANGESSTSGGLDELLPGIGSACAPGLRGTYCQLCANRNSYYVGATSDTSAHCESCDRLLSQSLPALIGVIAGLAVLISLLGSRIWFRNALLHGWNRLASSGMKNKSKIIIGFYQVRNKQPASLLPPASYLLTDERCLASCSLRL